MALSISASVSESNKTNQPAVVLTVVTGLAVLPESEVDVGATTKRRATAWPFRLVLVHGVLKWLHHPDLKYVML